MLPLCVDLDGTLIRSDVLFESAALLLRQKPWLGVALPAWLAGGKARMKREIARRVRLNAALLPYHEEFVEWVAAEHRRGRIVVLATASDQLLANSIAGHLALFDVVIGSDGNTNQKGAGKLDTLTQRYGSAFAYAGNSSSDLAIWRGCEEAIVVNASPATAAAARALGTVSREFPPAPLTYAMTRRVLRVRISQALLVAAIVPTLQTGNSLWATGALSLACLVSGSFIVRDLLNLEQDRARPEKAAQPVTSGVFPIAWAFFLGPGLVAFGLSGMAYIAWRTAG